MWPGGCWLPLPGPTGYGMAKRVVLTYWQKKNYIFNLNLVISAAWRRGAGQGGGGDGASTRPAGQSVLSAVSAAFHGTTCGE